MLRSSLALRSRNDVSQFGVAQNGQPRVLFLPGGDVNVPGTITLDPSKIWFSSNAGGMQVHLIGTALQYTAIPAMSATVVTRNPLNTVHDGRNAAVGVVRFINPTRDRFVEFGYVASTGRPYMSLYNATSAYTYLMKVTFDGFDIVPVTLATMAASIATFPNQADREGYTVFFTDLGDQGDVNVDALKVCPYISTDADLAMGIVLTPTLSILRLRNTALTMTDTTAGVAGALGTVLTP